MKLVTLLGTLALIILTGTVFFHHVEGWSWLDSYFFTVVTLSTVGYGEIVPVTDIGKIGTTVFILVGLGIFAVTVQQFGQYAMRKREEHTEWLVARLGTAEEDSAANADDPPMADANRDRHRAGQRSD